jgi:hypothetical protein
MAAISKSDVRELGGKGAMLTDRKELNELCRKELQQRRNGQE